MRVPITSTWAPGHRRTFYLRAWGAATSSAATFAPLPFREYNPGLVITGFANLHASEWLWLPGACWALGLLLGGRPGCLPEAEGVGSTLGRPAALCGRWCWCCPPGQDRAGPTH